MPREIQGSLQANGLRVAIITARFNHFIGKGLLDGALDCLYRHGASEKDITIITVPGAFEIPLATRRVLASGTFDAVVCLGIVIRGATPHFEYVAGNAASGIAALALEFDTPVGFGVLTTDTIEQAVERAGTKAGNKGWDAALAAIEMTNVLQAMAALK